MTVEEAKAHVAALVASGAARWAGTCLFATASDGVEVHIASVIPQHEHADWESLAQYLTHCPNPSDW